MTMMIDDKILSKVSTYENDTAKKMLGYKGTDYTRWHKDPTKVLIPSKRPNLT